MKKTICHLAAVCLLTIPVVNNAQKPSVTEQWLTTGDSTILFQKSLVNKLTSSKDSTIVLNAKHIYQTVEGFGYALTQGTAMHLLGMSAGKRDALLHELFDTTGNGIGVSYLRLSIASSDLNDKVFSYDDVAGDTSLSHFDIAPDRKDVIPVLKEILRINPHITLMASPWSPPAWMKTNNDTRGGRIRPEYYEVYANYFVKYLQAMKQEGFNIDAITLQNEPLHPGNNPSLLLTAPEETEFIKSHIGPLFKKLAIKTKIIVYDHNCNRPDYPLYVLNDSQAKQYVVGSGFHLYEGTADAAGYVHDQHPDKNIYFTEQWVVQFNENRKPDEPKLNVSGVVTDLHIGAMRNWSRNVLQWNISSNPAYTPFTDRGGCNVCQGGVSIKDDAFEKNLAYYTMAHFSKFMRPGAVRIESNLLSDLPNVAFKNASGKIVLVVANASAGEKSFNINAGVKTVNVSLPAKSVATYIF